MTPVGAPAMIRSFNVAPDGGAFRVTYTIKPFSYLVPASQFGWREELWDATGKVITELNKRDLTFEETTTDPPPVQPTTPARGGRGATGAQLAQARPEGRRSLAWRPDGVGMSFLQLEPAPERREGEQPATEGQRVRKDRVMQWLPPYGPRDTKVIYESETPIVSVRYSADCQLLFVNETRAGSDVLYAINLKERGKKYPLYTRSTTDPTNRPGTLVTRPSLTGVSAVHVSPDGRVFLTGTEGSRNPTQTAPRPYLDQITIETGKSERIWQSAEDRYEQVQSVLDEGATLVLVRSESPTEVPNSYLVRLPSKEAKQLTDNKDYAPEVTQAEKHRLQITRQDGLKFWCEVVMPRFAVKGFRRPAIFWFYPREYRDQRGYDESQRNYNKNAFSQPGAMAPEYFVTQGYVVVKPDCPIIGAANAINDNYVSELRNNLAATIDELERQGFIDRSRLALGGHSYGAFSTVNAMVHTPFFKAGIAGHGNYNRTLTPFAFQSERRQLWEAKWVYQEMSPLFYAERLTGALLLYHGLDDQNVGTDPINSTNLFQALEALGKTAAVYMYPYEGHGPAARETLLDMWARWIAWLEKHVKATPEAATQSDAGPSDG